LPLTLLRVLELSAAWIYLRLMAHGLLSSPASRATRQLPDQSTIIRVEIFLRVVSRLRGARPQSDIALLV
jgi:hypothetical protein